MKPKLRAKLRAVGLVGVPIFLLVANLGLWWSEGYLSDYVAAFPTKHFFADDYEPQTLLEIQENVVSGAHRTVQGALGGIISNIFNNKKQDFKEVLEQSAQPKDHYLGFIRPGDFCLLTSETSGEIWCQRVIKAGERDSIPYWSWPPQTERPYLFTRLLPQLFLSPTNQPQTKEIEALVQRHPAYWLKPSTQPQLQHQTGYFYRDRLKNTIPLSRAENAALWTSRVQTYHRVQMLFAALLLFVSPVSLVIFYRDRLTSLFKRSLKWKRRRDSKRQTEAESILEPKVIQIGGEMSEFIEDEEGTGLISKQHYPAKASNALMGTLLSLGFRWKVGTEMKDIERLTALITVKTKLSEVSIQQLEAEKQLAMKLAESGGITPKLTNKLKAQGYYRLVALLKQKEELQDLDHEDAVLTKKLAITEKERKLEELKNPRKPKRQLNRREQEEREIKQIMTEAYSQLRKKVAQVDAVYKAAAKAKEHARERYRDDLQLLEEIERKIDFWKDNDTQFIGTEYQEDENLL